MFVLQSTASESSDIRVRRIGCALLVSITRRSQPRGLPNGLAINGKPSLRSTGSAPARARGIDPAEIRQELKRMLGSKMGTAFDGMRADDLLELLGCPSPPTDRGSARSVIPSPPVDRPTD